ncbi:MAG: hypothetical protein LBL57_06275, partial [Tannerella sp.]|nr:hypothetical protein [Tannerella sp.]
MYLKHSGGLTIRIMFTLAVAKIKIIFVILNKKRKNHSIPSFSNRKRPADADPFLKDGKAYCIAPLQPCTLAAVKPWG